MKRIFQRLTAIGLSIILATTGSGVAHATDLTNADSYESKTLVQSVHENPAAEGTVYYSQEEPETDTKQYHHEGGYISSESDRNVPVIVDDGDYEGMDIEDQAYDEAYASISLEDIKLQNANETDEDMITDASMGASSADVHYDNTEKMPSVRNQGEYGTCWAFSTLAAVEGDLIADGAYSSDLDLSELHLTYYTYHFNTSVQSDPLGGTKGDSVLHNQSYSGKDYLMAGGNTIHALKALMAWTGAVKEEKEPYSRAKSTLSVQDSRGLSTGQYTSDVHVNGWYAYNMSSPGDRILIKDAIIKHGAVAASIFDNENYYDKNNNSYYDPRDTDTNHAIAIVGWDDTIPTSSFKDTPAGPGAWLVRNSWGTDGYDYDGYFWLSYYNKANYAENATGHAAYAVDATPASEDYDNNYTYDGQIGSDGKRGNTKSYSAVNVFTANSNEVLEAIAFEAYSSKVDYTVDIYTDVHPTINPDKNVTDPNLKTATHVDTISGTTTAKGYYQLKLNNPVPLSKGQTFAVKVTISHEKENEYVYLGAENATAGWPWLKQTAASPLGEGFGYTYKWNSVENSSFCIKAYTDNRRTTGLTSVSITGQSDGDVLNIGGEYILKAQGNNNALISSVKWSSSNENVISVKERTRYSSMFDVKNEGSAKVTATVYGIDGSGKPVSFTKSLNFTVKGAAVQNVTVSDSYGNNTGKSEKGKTVTLRAMITEGSTENNMKWTTSDSSVVSIAPSSDKMSCTVTPKALGSALITATASNGKTGSYKITIVKPANSVTIGWGSWRDEAGIDLNYSSSQGTRDYWYYELDGFIDGDSTDTDLEWSSDNHSIITIEDVFVKNGIPRCTIKVRPVAGKTTITARSPYSGAQGSFTFITYKNPVTAVSIKDAASGRVEKGKSITLTAEYSPKNADYGTELEWSVSDSGRLSLKENANGTCTVTGLNSGVAYVTATSIKTGESCDYKVTVWTPVDSIQVFDNDKKKSCTLNIGSTNYLTGYLNSDAEPGQDMTVTWTSSDESVATVKKTSNDSSYYSYATITAQNPGSAVITATTANGLKDTYKVTVTATAVSQVKLNRSSLVLNKGDSESLTATVYPAGAANKNVRWSSSDTSVAEVSDSGRITARSRGTADITVTTEDGGYKASCRVTVVNNDDIYVTDAAGETSGKKEVDSSVVLTVESRSAMSVNVSQWTITNSSVAEIVPSKDKQSCRVTPKASGTATIAVTTVYGETAEYELKVISPITSVSLKIGESKDYAIQVNPGQSRQLTLTAELNEEATDTDLVWTSDNPEIVTIAQTYVNGRTPGCIVEAQPVAGKAVIRAISPYSGVSDTFTVTIYKEPVSGITISGMDPSGLEKGKSATLTAGFAPENADYGTQIEWSADTSECIKIKANPDGTCTVTGLDSGTAYVKAASKDINVYDTQRVLVWVPVTSIKIQDPNGAKGSTLKNGEETVLTSKLNDDATDSQNFGVTWKSSNPEVASIHITEQTGNTTHARLIAESPGNAVITATTSNGLTAKYTVEVLARVTGVQIDETEITIDRGKSKLLKATVTPSEAADNTINWSSSDESVATVDPYGLVKAINPGAAWIKAQSNDGPYWAECQVTVEIPADSLTLDQTSLSIGTGDTVHLTAQFSPADATNKNLRWESSDRGVAVVEDGNVTAVGSGNATITARSETGLTASCEVSVVSKVTGVTLNESQLYLMVGDTDHLVAKVSPSDATEQGIVWTSGDGSVVTVNDTGEITAVAEGSTYITAETKDGGYKATCLVTVATLPEAEIEIGEIGTENTITYGNAIQPAVKISIKGTPAKGTAETKIVDENGNTVEYTYPEVGTYKYVVNYKAEDGYGTAGKSFTVTKAILTADMFTVSPASLMLGDREPDITLSDTSLRLGSNVVCESKYFLKGESARPFTELEKPGTYHILLWTAGEGNFNNLDGMELTQTVRVKKPKADPVKVTGVDISPASAEILKSETTKLIATLTPEDATDKRVTWKSSDETKVTVTSGGIIRGIAEGTATITAESGGIEGTATVTVIKDAEKEKILEEIDEPSKEEIAEDLNGGRISDLIGTDPDAGNTAVTIDASGNIINTNVWVGGIESEYTYTGAAIKPEPHVYDGTTRLVKGTDYTVSYSQNKAVGTATITVKFKGNYKNDTKRLTFKIVPAVLGRDVIVTAATLEAGKAVKPDIAFIMASTGEKLNNGKFNVPAEKINLTADETKEITVSAKDLASITGTANITIEAAAKTRLLSNARVTIKKQTYKGYEIIPQAEDITVRLGTRLLTYGDDYDITDVYNNHQPGKATVIINGIGEYTGSRVANFTIAKGLELKDADTTVTIKSSVPYIKGGATPDVTVSLNNGTKLTKGTDYTVKYVNNKKIGDASIKITFKGKYKGSKEAGFKVEKQNLGALSIVANDVTKSNKADFYKNPSLTITDLNGKKLSKSDYTIGSDYKYDEEAGTVTVSLTGKGCYSEEAVNILYHVVDKNRDIKNAKALNIADQTYTGRAVTVTANDLTGKLTLNGTTLTAEDYEIDAKSYINNIKKGTASFVIRGKGSYGGVKTLKFRIVQKPVKWMGVYQNGGFTV